ncbi:uncharacterized protein LOC124818142 [Hydra vulgaris]|uniref:uncharacterized protein LOC124818142 n=1 Tax=Hydra vulgaris TaxID=6087 RepID=UPI001F5EC676|nr:uncharacterized protein LOC124818142 [Hydra vulgaris]
MVYICIVKDCLNSIRDIINWKNLFCEEHGCLRKSDLCYCNPPFRLFPFPITLKCSIKRNTWIKLINRKTKERKYWEPSKDSRVCSNYFVDKEASIEFPNPTLNLGYNATEKSEMLLSTEMFYKLHEKISPLIKRHYRQKDESKERRNFQSTPEKIGPLRKLVSQDEMLICLMKLRLGLLTTDLSDRFGISEGLCSSIFKSWLRALAEYLKSFVYAPDLGTIIATTPERFHQFKNLFAIIDCSEIFIETPKDSELQSATWSEYKHHNTLKFLIGVAPNSSIIFVSKAFTGRISDKKITFDSKFLELVPSYSLMADKGFNLIEECVARKIYFITPSGRRGTSQMIPSGVSKTSAIAKVRILVEQVIRRLKTFRIISQEVPISLMPCIDDILVVCSALCNFKEPIMTD